MPRTPTRMLLPILVIASAVVLGFGLHVAKANASPPARSPVVVVQASPESSGDGSYGTRMDYSKAPALQPINNKNRQLAASEALALNNPVPGPCTLLVSHLFHYLSATFSTRASRACIRCPPTDPVAELTTPPRLGDSSASACGHSLRSVLGAPETMKPGSLAAAARR